MRSESPIMPALWIMLALVAAAFIMLANPDVFYYILIGFLVLAGIAAAGIVAFVIYSFVRNKFSPVRRVRSRVIRKRKKDWDVSLVGGTPESHIAKLGMLGRHYNEARKAYSRAMARNDVPEVRLAGGSDYFVTFDVDGREEEFCVSETDFIKCVEGAKGLLVFQREKFKHFMLQVE